MRSTWSDPSEHEESAEHELETAWASIARAQSRRSRPVAHRACDAPVAHVVEHLLALAVSLALSSEEQSTRHWLASLLRAVLAQVETEACALPIQLASLTHLFPAVSEPRPAMNRDDSSCSLTTRQREILHLRANGLSVQEIAEMLTLTPSSVQSHIRDAVERLGVSGGVLGAIAEARRRGMLEK
jgi:DNA-binding NarL/FixJ family response regulator